MMSVPFGHLGPDAGIVTYIYDLISPDSAFEAHLKSLEQAFSALQAADLTLKPTKLQFGQKEIDYLGLSYRKKAFQSVPTVPKPI